ncbi:hypothetical protein G9464_14695 [Halostella sp. JP-L12]|uniref:hypothetical protein n=1 Tax=Halostella TaxID=1843185 RepID=UPI000EF7694E|nr:MULTISPECIES: hypothetical protein [Halostella]NHN48835.1 hypothetical protein [Halostella sp. JP-L12]
MNRSRRTFLQASGTAALLGLAGCTGVLQSDDGLDEDGPPGYTTWLYDPKDLLDVDTRGFASYDVQSVMEQRENLPEDPFQGIEDANEEIEAVDLEEVERLSLVGGGETDYSRYGLSFAVEGSFDAAAIGEEIESESDGQEYETDTHEGYDLYYGEQESDYSNESFAVAVDGDAVVFGMVDDESVTGRAAAEAMIDADAGSRAGYYGESEYARILVDAMGEATFVMGAEFDLGSAVRDRMEDDRVRDLADGLHAAGVAGTLGGETSDYEFVLAYEADAEIPTESAQELVDEAREQSPEAFEHVEEVDVRSGDRTLTLVATVDSEELFDDFSGLMGGMTGTASGGATASIPQVSFRFDWAEADEGGRVTITHEAGDSVAADRLSIGGDVVSTTEWSSTSDGMVQAGSSAEATVESGGQVWVEWSGDDGQGALLATSQNPY